MTDTQGQTPDNVWRCWHCHWGWSRAVRDVFDRAIEALLGDDNPLLYGPAHIVWEDENWDSVDWCIEHFNEHRGKYTELQLAVVMKSLVELRDLPPETRDPCPKDYDGQHPDKYPPVGGVKMARCGE